MPNTVGLIPKEAMIAGIGSAYSSAAQRIVRALRDVEPGTYSPASAAEAIGKVRRIVDELDLTASHWAGKSIKAAYSESLGIAETRLKVIGAEKPKPRRGAKPKVDVHAKALAKFTKLTAGDLMSANRSILTTAGKYLALVAYAKRKIDQRFAGQIEAFSPEEARALINRTVIGSVTARTKYNAGEASLTSKDVAANIYRKLLDQLGGADFININGRNFNLKDYSELVARTRMREAQTEAVLKACEEYGNDLVEIPRHDHPCPICAEHQGKVFSISGNSKDYPKLPDGGPPWHPNCEDVANPTSERALRWRAA